MHRRHLLHALAAAPLTLTSARLFATPPTAALEKTGTPEPLRAIAERAEALERGGVPALPASARSVPSRLAPRRVGAVPQVASSFINCRISSLAA